ncbi:hypothetical protein DLAC_05470 [Tieghemostelium lacteum]|uniref:Uncharacterized protein n=1 Tax=Tieghemostelium lacteum TaxID=361077 RepID=A0A151ZG84_TIELA|nr:hypothetical protein DLAC_05470 [Tieghemostelium lacteum]|eukprot:KYQ92880.1 hypothetical protein DLAC_05470 [Tieghemostelium lacteum]
MPYFINNSNSIENKENMNTTTINTGPVIQGRNLESDFQLYKQELIKFKNDFKHLERSAHGWTDSLYKLKEESNALAHGLKDIGFRTGVHKDANLVLELSYFFDNFYKNCDNLYIMSKDNFEKPLCDVYTYNVKSVESIESKVHFEKLEYQQKSTEPTRSNFSSSFNQFQQLMSDLESKNETGIPNCFKTLVMNLDHFFTKGCEDIKLNQLPSTAIIQPPPIQQIPQQHPMPPSNLPENATVVVPPNTGAVGTSQPEFVQATIPPPFVTSTTTVPNTTVEQIKPLSTFPQDQQPHIIETTKTTETRITPDKSTVSTTTTVEKKLI